MFVMAGITRTAASVPLENIIVSGGCEHGSGYELGSILGGRTAQDCISQRFSRTLPPDFGTRFNFGAQPPSFQPNCTHSSGASPPGYMFCQPQPSYSYQQPQPEPKPQTYAIAQPPVTAPSPPPAQWAPPPTPAPPAPQSNCPGTNLQETARIDPCRYMQSNPQQGSQLTSDDACRNTAPVVQQAPPPPSSGSEGCRTSAFTTPPTSQLVAAGCDTCKVTPVNTQPAPQPMPQQQVTRLPVQQGCMSQRWDPGCPAVFQPGQPLKAESIPKKRTRRRKRKAKKNTRVKIECDCRLMETGLEDCRCDKKV